jgi:hypothetical protein
MKLSRLHWLLAGSAALNLFLIGVAATALAQDGPHQRVGHARHEGRPAGTVSLDPATGVLHLPTLRVEG